MLELSSDDIVSIDRSVDQNAPPAMEGWDDIDPENDIAGHFYDSDGNKHYIRLNDPQSLKLANDMYTDGIFQFDTDLAKSILSNGVRNFEDLMLFNAMGHPGPMQSIPEAVENREDTSRSWKNKLHEIIYDILKDTYGVIVYQEQLQAIWQNLAGFTAPEAQEARKAVAKKLTHLLKPIREKWLKGSEKALGKQEAADYWSKMETFGRYAFNRCLSEDTILVDAVDGSALTVRERWYSGIYPSLYSYVDGEVVVDSCVDIHDNGEMEVFEICFDDGTKEHVTMHHQFMCEDGQYHEVSEIIEKGLEVKEVSFRNTNV